jgi:hypothetical protein
MDGTGDGRIGASLSELREAEDGETGKDGAKDRMVLLARLFGAE